jgi:radical SAM protein with 4Fe4S-binding SPASM domain
MGIRYNFGRQGRVKQMLFRLRKNVPMGLKKAVWRKTGRRIFRKKAFEQQVPFFRSIELETRTRCNSSCSFCAASILTDTRPDILMPVELYEKILAELAERNYDGNIKFFVNNEPLLDKRTAEFIRMAKKQVPACKTEVHTNGLKLNPKSGRELLEAGLDLMVINNYSQKGEMHRGVKAFLEEVAPEFPGCEIEFNLRLLEEQLLNRAGTAPNGQLPPEPLALPCILPFEEMVVTADGRVTICCQDHYFEGAVGNLNEHSLFDIWYSSGFLELRAQLQEGDRTKNKFCQVCDFSGYKEENMTRFESVLNRIVGKQMFD